MTWQDRLQPEILLHPPKGLSFSAHWRGGSRDMRKKLGVFEYPKVVGSTVQDLDVESSDYPLSFYFEGPDHDLVAERFYQACKLRGPWQIEHPTKGRFKAYLVSVSEAIEPVESGNMTVFETEWIEAADSLLVMSTTQRQAVVRERVTLVKDSAVGQFAAKVKINKPSLLTQFRAAVTNATRAVANTLTPLTRTMAEVNAAVESVHRGIASAVIDPALNIVALASQIYTAVTLPSLVPESVGVRLDYYRRLIEDIESVMPEKASEAGVNVLATQELIATASLAGAASAVIDGDPSTREEAVEFMRVMTGILTGLTDNLDAGQALYTGQVLDRQFFSQSESYTNAALLVAETNAMLMRRLFDLASAKHITLQRHRAPVEIAITEGVDLDVFLESNQLSGNDILLLPPGREVVVFL